MGYIEFFIRSFCCTLIQPSWMNCNAQTKLLKSKIKTQNYPGLYQPWEIIEYREFPIKHINCVNKLIHEPWAWAIPTTRHTPSLRKGKAVPETEVKINVAGQLISRIVINCTWRAFNSVSSRLKFIMGSDKQTKLIRCASCIYVRRLDRVLRED